MAPDKAILEDLYLAQHLSMDKIAAQFQVSHSTVRDWLDKHQIPVRPKDSPDKWNSRKDEIIYLYTTLDFSQQQIANYFNAHLNQIQRVMKRLGIPIHPPGRRAGESHVLYKDGKSRRGYRKLIVKDQCSHCGTTEKLCIHHKNDDHYDNRLENLEILCHSCHMSHTKKAWWAAKKAGLPTPKSTGIVGWTRKK